MLLAGLLLLASLAPEAGTATLATPTCTYLEQMQGDCRSADITNTGTTIEISDEQTGPGSNGSNDQGNPDWQPAPPPNSKPLRDGDVDDGDTQTLRCIIVQNICHRPGESTPEDAVVLEVTLSDLASFAPGATVLAAEPDGVGLVGAPTNFVAPAAQHTATGELFDLPVTVRFTPASFLFDYGDGTTREATTGGTSWSALGQPQFTATATSHAYAARGTYTTSATVRYTAAVDFGAGWIAVPGVLQIPSAPAAIEIFELRTALVAHTCLEDPTGPGC